MPHAPRSLRVVVLSWRDLHHPEAGGAEHYLHEVATGLVARGHRVTVLTARYPGALADEVIDGVRFVRRGGHHTVYLWAMLATALRRHRADVLVDVQNGVPFLSPLVTRRPVVNLVHHVHREQWPIVFGPRVARLGWWLESRLAPLVYRRSRYVTVSRSTRDELVTLGVPRDHIALVYNGTDATRDPDTPRATDPVVAVLGRLVPQKRVEVALEATRALIGAHPRLRLLVIGSGYWESHLRAEALRLGIQDAVEFTGHVSEDEKHRLLATAWVLALPSVKEGWGLVVVEAGTHGTPTVAFSGAGGLDESVRHGQTGLLVDGGPAEFAEAVGRLLGDDVTRVAMGTAAADWARQFRWSQTVERFEEELVRTRARTRPSTRTSSAEQASGTVVVDQRL